MLTRNIRRLVSVMSGTALMTLMGVVPHAQTSNSAQSPVKSNEITSFQVNYTGSLFIFSLGTLSVAGNLNDFSYGLRADMQSAGLAKITKEGGMWTTTAGQYDAQNLRPKQHIIQKLNKKGRRVTLDYDAMGNPVSTINPRFGSMGQPAATPDERKGSLDALSGIMKLMMIGHKFGDTPCTGTIPVFDGKQRYNLRLEHQGTKFIRQGSYKGDAVKCNLYMDIVSGYDLEDLPSEEESSTPIEMYLANYEEAGLWLPVRFDYRVSGIKVNIRATRIQIARQAAP